MNYPLATQGIFRTVQGEGFLLGTPMVFIRLAGCSIGCPLCDTDYKKKTKKSAEEIAKTAAKLKTGGIEYVWITGGEPTDHDLGPLVDSLNAIGFHVALATAGHKKIPGKWRIRWLSVSPHDPNKWVQRWGSELKIVSGLNGFSLSEFMQNQDGKFDHRYVSPCEGKPETVNECVKWIEENKEWKMTVQGHKSWGLA